MIRPPLARPECATLPLPSEGGSPWDRRVGLDQVNYSVYRNIPHFSVQGASIDGGCRWMKFPMAVDVILEH